MAACTSSLIVAYWAFKSRIGISPPVLSASICGFVILRALRISVVHSPLLLTLCTLCLCGEIPSSLYPSSVPSTSPWFIPPSPLTLCTLCLCGEIPLFPLSFLRALYIPVVNFPSAFPPLPANPGSVPRRAAPPGSASLFQGSA